MSKEILNRMSSDLQIIRFENEDDILFEGRLLYSAIAAWCRNMVKDKSYNDISNMEIMLGVDVKHTIVRLAQIIDSMLDIFPYGRQYFKKANNKPFSSNEIAVRVIKDMTFSYECSRVLDDKRRLCETPYKNVIFHNSAVLILGGTDYKSMGKCVFIGCGKWLVTSYDDDNENCYKFWGIPKNSENYLIQLTKYAEWRDAKIDGEYRMIDISKSMIKKYGVGWNEFSKRNIAFPLEIVQKDGRFYLLRQGDEGEFQIAELNQWYLDENEFYRIIYAIKAKYFKPYEMKVKDNGEYVVVAIGATLPNPEMRILLLSSWGYNNSFDRFNRIIPIKIWQAIKPIFENLGFKINYI